MLIVDQNVETCRRSNDPMEQSSADGGSEAGQESSLRCILGIFRLICEVKLLSNEERRPATLVDRTKP